MLQAISMSALQSISNPQTREQSITLHEHDMVSAHLGKLGHSELNFEPKSLI